MSMPTYTHPLDVTGRKPENRVDSERHVVNQHHRYIAPHFRAFFTDAIIVKHNENTLIAGTDYTFAMMEEEAVRETGKDVATLIKIRDGIDGVIFITYQAVGGIYERKLTDVSRVVNRLGRDVNSIHWFDIGGVPEDIFPKRHLHHYRDIYGATPYLALLAEIADNMKHRILGDHTDIKLRLTASELRLKNIPQFTQSDLDKLRNDILLNANNHTSLDNRVTAQGRALNDRIDATASSLTEQHNSLADAHASLLGRFEETKQTTDAKNNEQDGRLTELETFRNTAVIRRVLTRDVSREQWIDLVHEGNFGFTLEVYRIARYEQLFGVTEAHANRLTALEHTTTTQTDLLTTHGNRLNDIEAVNRSQATTLVEHQNQLGALRNELTNTNTRIDDLANNSGDLRQSLNNYKEQQALIDAQQNQALETFRTQVTEEHSRINENHQQLATRVTANEGEIEETKAALEKKGEDLTGAIERVRETLTERINENQGEAARAHRRIDEEENTRAGLASQLENHINHTFTNLASKVDDFKGQFDTHVTKQQQRDQAQDDRLDGLDTSVTSINSDIGDLRNADDNIRNSVDDLARRHGQTQLKAEQNSALIEALQQSNAGNNQSLSERIDGLKQQHDTLAGKVLELEPVVQSVPDLRQDHDTLSGQVTLMKTDILNRFKTNEANIESLTERVTTNEQGIGDLVQLTSNHGTAIGGLENQFNRLEGIQNAMKQYIDERDNLIAANVTANGERIDALVETVNQHKTTDDERHRDISDKISDLESRMDNAVERLDATDRSYEAIEARTVRTESDLIKLQNKYTTKVSELDVKDNELANRITAVEGKNQSQDVDIQNLSTSINGLGTRIGILETSLPEVSEKVTELERWKGEFTLSQSQKHNAQQTEIDNLKANVTTLTAYKGTNDAALETIRQKDSQQDSKLETHSTTLTGHGERLDALDQRIQEITGAASGQGNDLGDIRKKQQAYAQRLGTAETNITQLQANATQLSENITAVADKQKTDAGKIASLERRVTAEESKSLQLDGKIDGHVQTQTAKNQQLDGEIAAIKEVNAQQATTIAEHAGKISTMEPRVTDLWRLAETESRNWMIAKNQQIRILDRGGNTHELEYNAIHSGIGSYIQKGTPGRVNGIDFEDANWISSSIRIATQTAGAVLFPIQLNPSFVPVFASTGEAEAFVKRTNLYRGLIGAISEHDKVLNILTGYYQGIHVGQAASLYLLVGTDRANTISANVHYGVTEHTSIITTVKRNNTSERNAYFEDDLTQILQYNSMLTNYTHDRNLRNSYHNYLENGMMKIAEPQNGPPGWDIIDRNGSEPLQPGRVLENLLVRAPDGTFLADNLASVTFKNKTPFTLPANIDNHVIEFTFSTNDPYIEPMITLQEITESGETSSAMTRLRAVREQGASGNYQFNGGISRVKYISVPLAAGDTSKRYRLIVRLPDTLPPHYRLGYFCISDLRGGNDYIPSDDFHLDLNIHTATTLKRDVESIVRRYVTEHTQPNSASKWDLTKFAEQPGTEDWSNLEVDGNDNLVARGVIMQKLGDGSLGGVVFSPSLTVTVTETNRWRIPPQLRGRRAEVIIRAPSYTDGGKIIHSAVRKVYIDLPTDGAVDITIGALTSFGRFITVNQREDYQDAIHPRCIGLAAQTGMVTITA